MSDEIGWITLVDANAYFLNKRLDSTAWDALTVGSGEKDGKTAVLNMAFDRLRFCRDFEIPVTPIPTQIERLKIAQLETAYYLALHLADEDRRKGLQAQGVTSAGIVKENYGDGAGKAVDLDKLPFPSIVLQIMAEFNIADNSLPFYARDLARDENKTVNEEVEDL
jgi:hypothetical protein